MKTKNKKPGHISSSVIAVFAPIIMSPVIATLGHLLPSQSKTAALNILTEEHCNKQTLLELYLQPSRCQHGVKILCREKK